MQYYGTEHGLQNVINVNKVNGIDSPYEIPDDPEIHIETTETSAEDAANAIVNVLRIAGFLAVSG